MPDPACRIALLGLALLMCACAQTPPQAPPGLAGTSWQLVRFQGGDGRVALSDDKARYTVAFGADGNVSVRFDCNRGRGSWKSERPGQVLFGPMAMTRAMCPPGSLHDQLVKHWFYVRSYLVKGDHLYLVLMADGGAYQFEPLAQ